MAMFRFKLETVLRHRVMVEEECQRELAKGLRHRMILLGQLQQMQQTISESRRTLGDGLVGRVDMSQVADFARYSLQARQRAGDIVRRLSAAEKSIIDAREKLNKATRDRKALDLLKDRQRRAWQTDQDRREASAMDEMAVQAFDRRMLDGDVD
ncbi:MAG: flagellar export protein FliJ [Planctomycetes bacterium]|nr:flagellar export protein FliJ [Planctomycetota bacterium]